MLNPTFLKGLEELQSVRSDGLRDAIGRGGEIGKRYEKAKCKKRGYK